jgi:hypothetical protein
MSDDNLNEWQRKRLERKQEKADKKIVRDARWEKERTDRRLALHAKQFAESTQNAKQAQPISKRRVAELQRQATQIEPVTTPRPKGDIGKNEPYEMQFYVWKEGQIGTVTLLFKTDFDPQDD